MKKIFINTPYASDANSFWRCIGPMSYLAKASEGEIQIHCPLPGTSFQWDAIAQYDLIFMHRPCRQQDIQLIKMARTLNIPVWSDYDDWLFYLPDWNPHAEAYHQTQVQTVMAAAIACSDVVSVSTAELQKQFLKVNKNVVIIPNAYRTDIVPFRQPKAPARKDFYYWRGTNTHDGDLLSVLDGFRSLSKPTRFMGSPCYQVLSQMQPSLVQRQKHVDTILYWKMLYESAFKVMLFPLVDCHFNLCKSNIAWIEAIHAGSVIVAPNLPEWQHPGVITYTPHDSGSFLEAAEQAMSLPSDKVLEINTEAYNYMKQLYGIQNVNLIRRQLVDSILSPTFQRNKKDPFQADLTGLWALSVLKGEELPRAPQAPTPAA
jgi:hypothetical protein